MENGRRWYDSAKVIWSLVGLLTACLGLISGMAYSMVEKNKDRLEWHIDNPNIHRAAINSLEKDIEYIRDSLKRIEEKLK